LPIRLHLRMSAWEVKTDNRMTAKNVLSLLGRQPPRTSLTLEIVATERLHSSLLHLQLPVFLRGHLNTA
jgi:hypothetical protein